MPDLDMLMDDEPTGEPDNESEVDVLATALGYDGEQVGLFREMVYAMVKEAKSKAG